MYFFYFSSPVLKLEVIYRSGFWLKPQVAIDKTRHDEWTSGGWEVRLLTIFSARPTQAGYERRFDVGQLS